MNITISPQMYQLNSRIMSIGSAHQPTKQILHHQTDILFVSSNNKQIPHILNYLDV